MKNQEAKIALLGAARLQPYLDSAGDIERAFELYLWATEVAGAVHAQLSFVEIAVRNALNFTIAHWNEDQGEEFGRDWSLDHQAAPELYSLMKNELKKARANALKAAQRRDPSHPRQGTTPTHDDVVAQLNFGSWSTLIAGQRGNTARQEYFWNEVTHLAFPGLDNSEHGRTWAGHQLEELRELRNRVAHHDNILRVNLTKRLNLTLALLAKVNPDFPSLATARSPLRRMIREDPRLQHLD